VDKEQAEKALEIIRDVIQNTRDDLTSQNWGLIWMFHAFTNLAGFVAIGLFVESRSLTIYWYLVPLAVNAAVNFAILICLVNRDRGVRSYVELQLHGIWITYISFSIVAAGVLHISGASPRLFCPILSMTTGISFAMMGILFNRIFLAFAPLFMGLMLLAPFVQDAQWILFGALWWIGLFVPGLAMHRVKLRRLKENREAQIV